MKRVLLLMMWCSVVILAAGLGASNAHAAGKQFMVYVGTLDGGKGIYASQFDSATGKLAPLSLAAEVTRPAFLALHPNRKFLYSVGETQDGVVRAFAIEPKTGKLTLLNEVSSRGNGPCYVSVDPAGKNAFAANYGSGSVVVYPIQKDGKLGESTDFIQDQGSSVNPARQTGPHAHMIQTAPGNRFVLYTDLGLDKIFVNRFDAKKGKLTPAEPPFTKASAGAGPRHFAFSPNGKFVYVINELACSITVYAWDGKAGTLTEKQTVPALPADFKGQNTSAQICVHPSGKFLYGSNRGHDSIAVYAIDPKLGTLTLVEHVSSQGKTPRNFNLDPTGKWLIAANQASNNLVIFAIDEKTGKLTDTGQRFEVAAPSCVQFLK